MSSRSKNYQLVQTAIEPHRAALVREASSPDKGKQISQSFDVLQEIATKVLDALDAVILIGAEYGKKQ